MNFNLPTPLPTVTLAALGGLILLCFIAFSISAPQAATRKSQLRDKTEGI